MCGPTARDPLLRHFNDKTSLSFDAMSFSLTRQQLSLFHCWNTVGSEGPEDPTSLLQMERSSGRQAVDRLQTRQKTPESEGARGWTSGREQESK